MYASAEVVECYDAKGEDVCVARFSDGAVCEAVLAEAIPESEAKLCDAVPVAEIFGADACGDLVREGDIEGGRSADELRRDWAGHLGRDDDAVAGILKALEAGAAPLDDLRRPDAFREHNGKIRKDARVAVRREKAAQEGPS